MTSTMELSYRIAAVDTGSPIGLLLALYDTLSGNLRRAAIAIRSQEIERRCAELSHAYVILGQLESWVDPDRDHQLAESLTLFYAYLRAQMLQASLAQSASTLDALIALVVQVRTAWQQREATLTSSSTPLHDTTSQPADSNRVALSQTA